MSSRDDVVECQVTGPKPIIRLDHWFHIYDMKGESIAQLRVFPRHGVLFISDLWVHDDHRKKGYGRALIERAIQEFGHTRLYLQVHAYQGEPISDTKLIRWYQTFGFKQVINAPGMMRREGKKPNGSDDGFTYAEYRSLGD